MISTSIPRHPRSPPNTRTIYKLFRSFRHATLYRRRRRPPAIPPAHCRKPRRAESQKPLPARHSRGGNNPFFFFFFRTTLPDSLISPSPPPLVVPPTPPAHSYYGWDFNDIYAFTRACARTHTRTRHIWRRCTPPLAVYATLLFGLGIFLFFFFPPVFPGRWRRRQPPDTFSRPNRSFYIYIISFHITTCTAPPSRPDRIRAGEEHDDEEGWCVDGRCV